MFATNTAAAGGALDFLRGDANADGIVDISDGVRTLGFLFLGEAPPPCGDAADANDDGIVDVSDAIATFGFLFLGGNPPPDPGIVACGPDPTVDVTTCERFAPCSPPPAPVITSDTGPTSDATVLIEGTTRAGSTIEVRGGFVPAWGEAPDGRFRVPVELVRNRINRLFVIAHDARGTSAPAAVQITQDEEPPYLLVDEPRDDSEVFTGSVTVVGRVGDLLTGFMGLEVTVAGQTANVAPGIGSNGTFERRAVALDVGENQISVVARDGLGNTVERILRIVRSPLPAGVEIVSGNNQVGEVNSLLPQPLVVRVLRDDGSPFADKLVTFRVTRSDGRLFPTRPEPGQEGHLSLQVRTDGGGAATIFWLLGSDAGCGNQRVEATSASALGRAVFCASATPAAADRILIGAGDGQVAQVSSPLTDPLRVWVTDSCNGVPGVPVTFTVTRGGGTIEGASGRVVTTGITGHAQVRLVLGESAGVQQVEATFPGNLGLPVVFSASAIATSLAQTSFSGIVLDDASRPIEDATCLLLADGAAVATASTGRDGRFSFDGLVPGPARLFVDGLTATHIGGDPGTDIPLGSFPALSFETVLVAGASNSLGSPIRLPSLDPANAVVYDGQSDVELRMRHVAGVKMLVRAGSMRRADGSQPSPEDPAVLSLNPVHVDDIPMPLPDGAAPPLAWTLQPAGATFDPPVAITLPNMEGLLPGSTMNFLVFNHATDTFEIVASGRVSDDGALMVSDEGRGIAVAGWGGFCPPYPNTGSVANSGDPLTDPGVRQELEDSWNDSNPGGCEAAQAPCFDATRREQGGWIFKDGAGNFSWQRWPTDTDRSFCPEARQPNGDCTWLLPLNLCGSWHTHPNHGQSHDPQGNVEPGTNWKAGPSQGDLDFVSSNPEVAPHYVVEKDCVYIIQSDRTFTKVPTTDVFRQDTVSADEPIELYPQVALLDERMRVEISGRVAVPDTLGRFRVSNIPVTGTLVRASVTCASCTPPLYGRSTYLEVRNGQVHRLGPIALSATPPLDSVGIELSPRALVLQPGEEIPLAVAVERSDGSVVPAASRGLGTILRSSNPAVVTVSETGLVTALGEGSAFVTASNEGSFSVSEVLVIPSVASTTIEGIVELEDGTVVEGAIVSTRFDDGVVTDATGRFSFEVSFVPGESLDVFVSAEREGGKYECAYRRGVSVVPGQTTDLGILVLGPCVGHSSESPALSCLEIRELGADRGDGKYWIELPSGVFEVYCDFTSHTGGWTRVATLDTSAAFCGNGGVPDLRQNADAPIGKIPDADVHALLSDSGPSRAEIMYFMPSARRYVWHTLENVTDYDTSRRRSSSSFYCRNWQCDNGTTDSSACGSEGNGCPVTAHGRPLTTKKIYVDSSFTAHARGIHTNGGICGLPNFTRAPVWIFVR